MWSISRDPDRSTEYRAIEGSGAYAAGRMFALVLAVGLVAPGARAIARGRQARR